MSLSFPSNPTTNQTYTFESTTWQYNGTSWIQIVSPGVLGVNVSNTAPSSAQVGTLWWDSDTGDFSVYYNSTWAGLTSSVLTPGAITTEIIADGAVTSAKLASGAAVPSQAGQNGKFLTTDGTNASWTTVTTTPADGSITPVKLALGTTYLPMAIGTTAERPSSPAAGYTRINTTTNYFEVYYNSQWINLQYIGAMTVTYTGTPTVSTSGGFTTLKFNTSGSITVTNMQAGSTFEYLMVAGGGGGGNTMGGGGGAGGLLYNSGFAPTVNNQYSFTIGAGGTGAANRSVVGGSGTNTTGFTLTCIGGGGGAGWQSAGASTGGSGGGGVNAVAFGAGTVGQGYAGGSAGTSVSGGGGGGATAAGSNGASGPGGAGYTMSSIGLAFGGGGGGGWGSTYGTSLGGAGGAGGGGNGGQAAPGSDATINTGGGGGGGGYGPGATDHPGGAGGSGTVIIRYRST